MLLDARRFPDEYDVIVIGEEWMPDLELDDVFPGLSIDVRAHGRSMSLPVSAAPQHAVNRRATADLLVRLFGDVPEVGTESALEIQRRDAVSVVENALSSSLGDVAELVDRLALLLPRLPPASPPALDRLVVIHRSSSRSQGWSVDAVARWGQGAQVTTLDGGWRAHQLRPTRWTDHIGDLAAGDGPVVLLRRGRGASGADVRVAGRRHLQTWDGWLRPAEQAGGGAPAALSRGDGDATDPLVDVVGALGIPARALLLLDAPCIASYDEVRPRVSFLRVLVTRLVP
ncbi:hypothetical protein [Nocardioides zeae]